MGGLLDSVAANTRPKKSSAESAAPSHAVQSISGGRNSVLADNKQSVRHVRGSSVSVRQVLGAESDRLSGNEQSTTVNVGNSPYFFELQPFELKRGHNPGSDELIRLLPGTPLVPGKTYRIRTLLNRNSYQSQLISSAKSYQLLQEPKLLTDDVYVYLEVDGQKDERAQAVVGPIDYQRGRLSLDEPDSHHEFEFTIEADVSCAVDLVLTFQSIQGLDTPQPGARLTLSLRGSGNAPPPVVAKVLELKTHVAPPPHTAILHVSAVEQGRLSLVGWIGGRVNYSLYLDASALQLADPSDFTTEQEYLDDISNKVHDFSVERAGDVARWFRQALKVFRDDCCIVIVDQADSQVPWEMFKLDGGEFLGAQAFVVRWAEVQYRDRHISFPSVGTRVEGRLCAYVHPLDEREAPAISQLIPHYSTTTNDLERELLLGGGEGSQVGLIYLCYGGVLSYGDERETLKRLHSSAPYNTDVRVRFNLVEGRLDPRPVFFANAPYSGRIFASGPSSCGLAKAALAQVAASYIGVLAPVDRAYARQLAQKVLEAALSEEGIKPAELLRKLRAEAVERILDERLTAEEWERAKLEMIYPFLFVHYGSPSDWLKVSLSPSKAATTKGGEHE